jgi:hypothetical protein
LFLEESIVKEAEREVVLKKTKSMKIKRLRRKACSKLYGFNALFNSFSGLTPFCRIDLRF